MLTTAKSTRKESNNTPIRPVNINHARPAHRNNCPGGDCRKRPADNNTSAACALILSPELFGSAILGAAKRGRFAQRGRTGEFVGASGRAGLRGGCGNGNKGVEDDERLRPRVAGNANGAQNAHGGRIAFMVRA